MSGSWGLTPRQSIEMAARHEGADDLVARCVALLRGGETDEHLLLVLAGPAGADVWRGGAGGLGGYWPRVWALRALLYVWNETATTVVANAVSDEAWRVREMSAKVTARHLLDECFSSMDQLVNDDVERVRRAAERALLRLTQAGA